MTATRAALSTRLVEAVAAFDLAALPAPVVDRARLVLLDTLGEALAASALAHPTLTRLGAFAQDGGGRAEASLIGRGRRAPLATAAMHNAALAAFGLTEPLHLAASAHAPAAIAAVALAAAERARAGGARLLGGFLLGNEVACRVATALDPAAMQARGFHPTGIACSFGAAAAAAHVLGLGREEVAAALGLALHQAAGSTTWTTDPSETARPLSPGFAARNGATAALLAAHGLGGPPLPFDGRASAFTAFSGAGRPEALLDGWGARYYTAEMTHKLHASCSYTHAAIDALLALAAQHRLRPAEVREIVLRTAPSTRRATGDPGLRSCHAPRVLAIALVRGRVAIEDVLRPGDDDATARVAALVRVEDEPDLEPSHPLRCAAIVEVATGDGRRLVRRIDDPKGTAGNPLAAEETVAKFRAAASRAQGGAEVERIADLVARIERLARIDRLAALLRRTPIHGD